MPSKSKKQARFMAAVAHNPKFAKRVGVKQSVGREFNQADAGTGILRKAVGGLASVIGRAPPPRVVPGATGVPDRRMGLPETSRMLGQADGAMLQSGRQLGNLMMRAKGGKVSQMKNITLELVKSAADFIPKRGKVPLKYSSEAEDLFDMAMNHEFTAKEIRDQIGGYLEEAGLDRSHARHFKVITPPEFLEFDSSNPHHGAGYFNTQFKAPASLVEALEKHFDEGIGDDAFHSDAGEGLENLELALNSNPRVAKKITPNR